MYGVSSKQIKAARAMLDWHQDRLATASGLCIATIRSLEKGHVAPRSAHAVRTALEAAGLEFFANDGLGYRKETIRVCQGTDACDALLADMLDVLKSNNGNLTIMSKSPDSIIAALGGTGHANLERLEDLAGVATVKCLVSEVNGSADSAQLFQQRVLPKYYIGNLTYFAYSNRYVIALRQDDISFDYVVFRSVSLVQAMLREFTPLWNAAVPLEQIKGQKHLA